MSDLNQSRLIFSAAVLGIIFVVRYAIVAVVRLTVARHPNGRRVFWTRQGTAIVTAILIIAAMMTIWLDNPARAGTILGFASAGIAFALQKVITALAGYMVILRGQTFTVGDRIAMGGVRGDVVDLGFLQTRILEMGVPRETQGVHPSWIHERQYTGRIVTVTNDKVFDEPIFNYTREFMFMFDEIEFPLENRADRDRVEQIMLEAASRHTEHTLQRAIDASKQFEKKYFVDLAPIEPRVYYHMRDGILEMHVRYVTTIYDQRDVQDKVKRDVLAAFDRDNIAIKDMS